MVWHVEVWPLLFCRTLEATGGPSSKTPAASTGELGHQKQVLPDTFSTASELFQTAHEAPESSTFLPKDAGTVLQGRTSVVRDAATTAFTGE